WQITKRVKQSS
ncbi:glycine--tRNA ligase, beta subunit, partial [Vibrio parahaemolyticus V-223/04]